MDMKAIEDKITSAANAIEAVQQRLDGLSNNVDEAKSKADQIDTDMIKKASEAANTALQTMQELKAADKFAEISKTLEDNEKRFKDLEATVVRKGGGSDELKAALHGVNTDSKFGKFVIDRMGGPDPEARQAMAKYLRKGDDRRGVNLPSEEVVERICKSYAEKHLFGADDREMDMLVKDLVAGSGSEGGYFLTTDRSNRMIMRIFETSPIRSVASIETTTSDVMEFVLDDDEGTVGWVGEVQSRDNTETPDIGVLKIPVHEIFAQPRATQRMLDDAGFDIEGWLAAKTSRLISRTENLAFVNGSGSLMPRGFLQYPDWTTDTTVYQRNAVQRFAATQSTAATGSFGADDVIFLKNQLLEEYQANSAFGMSRQTFTTVMQLKNAEGTYLLNPAIVATGADKTLLGSEVVFMNDMPDENGSGGVAVMCVADWQEFYTIVDRFDIRILRDPYTQKPYIRFYTTKRVGGAVTNFDAGKILLTKS